MVVDFNMMAKWIWTKEWDACDERRMGGFVYFRKTFFLDSDRYTAAIRISADSRYKFYINGKRAAFGPCKGDKSTWYYDFIEINEYLKPGENVLAIQVLRYGVDSPGNVSVWRTQKPGLFLEGFVKDKDDNTIINLSTNTSWKCKKDSAIVLNQGLYTVFLGIGEDVSAKLLPSGWNSYGYKDDNWVNAMVHEMDTSNGNMSLWRLQERPIPMLRETAKSFLGIKSIKGGSNVAVDWENMLGNGNMVQINAHSSVEVELDAGELTTGFLQLHLKGGANAEIKILCAECYEYEPFDEPWLRNKNDRTDSVKGKLYGDLDIYKVAGSLEHAAVEFYETFWFRTFRYVRISIETKDQPLEIVGVNYSECGYPLDIKGEFQCSDEDYNKLWEVSIRTLRRCMHESYEDCPYYEQLQYAMDTRSQMLFTYCISGDDRLARKTIYDFHSSMLPEGLTQSRYPSYMGQVIPIFSIYWIFMIQDHMNYFGNFDLVRRYMASVDSILEYFHRSLDQHGLVGEMPSEYWSFIDWVDEWREGRGVPTASKKGPLTILSMAYIAALNAAAELAVFIGRNGIAEEYQLRAYKVKCAVLQHCSNRKNSYYTDGPEIEEYSQHTQIWAILSGVVAEEQAKHLLQNMLADKKLPRCSYAMTFYLFRALTKVNCYDRSGELWKPWIKMLEMNLTTWMEDLVSQRSDCHGWGALPLYEFSAEVLGIKPVQPGYSKIKIQPSIGRLNWAEGSSATPHGMVHVSWINNDTCFEISINGPANIPLELVLPNGEHRYFNNADHIMVRMEGSKQ